MAVVAGTPVIDSPTAWVTTSLPSTVTRTMTAFRCACAMVSRTTRITASALAVSVVGLRASVGSAPGAQPASRARAQHDCEEAPYGGHARILAEWPRGIAYFGLQLGIP